MYMHIKLYNFHISINYILLMNYRYLQVTVNINVGLYNPNYKM